MMNTELSAYRVKDMMIIKTEVDSPCVTTSGVGNYPQHIPWIKYLKDMGSDSKISHLILAAGDIWNRLSPIPNLPPQAGPNEDRNIFCMIWDVDRHHLEIEIDEESDECEFKCLTFVWFYRDRRTEECRCGEHCSIGDLLMAVQPYLGFFA